MKIHNVRLGAATNSSSTHSIVIAPGLADDFSGDGYGWEAFTLASDEAKCSYLAGLLAANINMGTMGEIIAKAVTGHSGDVGYVDHQSVVGLPVRRSNLMDGANRADLDLDFYRDFEKFVLRRDVAILGGNDNGGSHDLAGKFPEPLALMGSDGRFRIHATRSGPHWTLFDVLTGNKVRISFDENAPEFKKAQAPELVDLKITDFCPYGCDMCYMSSTLAGKHAKTEDINRLIYDLSEAGTFELAIGGGEPTLHPDFYGILSIAARYGLVPNFTTRNKAWFHVRENADLVIGSQGSVAFSVDDSRAISEWSKTIDISGIPRNRFHVQYIVGDRSKYELEHVLDAAAGVGLSVTLLGYKFVGRGAEVSPPKDVAIWHEIVASMRKKKKPVPRIGIDTALAVAGVPEEIPKWLYSTREGDFSCYMDAVEMRIGPSSYCVPEKMSKLGDDWLSVFRSY